MSKHVKYQFRRKPSTITICLNFLKRVQILIFFKAKSVQKVAAVWYKGTLDDDIYVQAVMGLIPTCWIGSASCGSMMSRAASDIFRTSTTVYCRIYQNKRIKEKCMRTKKLHNKLWKKKMLINTMEMQHIIIRQIVAINVEFSLSKWNRICM